MAQTKEQLEAIARRNLLGFCEAAAHTFNSYMKISETKETARWRNAARKQAENVWATDDAEGLALFESIIRYPVPAEPLVPGKAPIQDGIYTRRDGATEIYRAGRMVTQIWDNA